ncbi:MAG: M23 family metallopeptidase [Chitinophagaceae bacterium]|nr:M23 family metallopeptidase [Chitinophagaceae bacterium]
MKKILLFIAFILIAGAVFFWFGASSVTKNTDAYIYDLPFKKGASFNIVQGYGGFFSHYGTAAIDFEMPVGTPIYAAREGVVYSYKENNNEGGPYKKYKNKANYIMIKHPDGSFGCYWHLQYNGVVAKRGFVRKGDLIGYSGETGYVIRPHLHFSVKRILNYKKDSYLRTKFRTSKGILLLKRGYVYENPIN